MTRNTRRDFLKHSSHLGALGLVRRNLLGSPAPKQVIIRLDPRASQTPAKWAADYLGQVLIGKGVPVVPDGAGFVVTISQSSAPAPNESFRLTPEHLGVAITAPDNRGLVYGLLELADRVQHAAVPLEGLTLHEAIEEAPANRVRSIARAFVSEVEDPVWYYDKNFWREYLTTLATHRFNRFSMTFGLGYDFPRHVTGDYLHFPYPYLFEVPGYDVRVVPLAQGDRERNLEALKFISDETAARGMQFQIVLWTHAYQWTDSPNAHHRIEGLTPETHGPYCRDAMALLLKTCPAISGVTMRVHGESGIPEGSLPFWKYVFAGITSAGRPIELDMHAKGLDPAMLEMALATGLPVNISPKYWAEHMGLGYQQTAIRELEMPKPNKKTDSTFKLSEGSRSFLRYGYGDLFAKGRRYDVTFRLWPGSQRMLLWGDPVTAAAYGRASSFGGAKGVEMCEPLFFKGRQGSGLPGGRCAYADESLNPRFDFEKFAYTYRVWGRLLYNPQASPDGWQRALRTSFGPGAPAMEEAIANGSRVLPLFTTTRLPSASNLGCWPEVYTNMPIVEDSEPSPYNDTSTPKRLGTVSPLDSQLFSTIEEHCASLLEAKPSGKYSPIEIAQWFEEMAQAANKALLSAVAHAPNRKSAEFRRVEEDVLIEIGLATFFADQIRSAALYDIYRRTGDTNALDRAIEFYRKAHTAWASMATRAGKVYRPDISYGDAPVRRGHWNDRLPGIMKDLAAMEQLKTNGEASTNPKQDASQWVQHILRPPVRESVPISHTPPSTFRPGDVVPLLFTVSKIEPQRRPTTALLHYRHVNHAERWQMLEMQVSSGKLTASIPASYTNTEFAMQYYVEMQRGSNTAWLYPGLNLQKCDEPYFVVPLS